ncbi:hypothetical protein HID58_016856 [Brassica napus]|uniref:DUF1985 domain-containing protein n=1 Tax=Brassica napus TaxID=3708 RepID=A0ABQ8D5G2_BRANA|nr:hypothetical protein HID58_016856 [Brassica napus]
MNPSVQFPEDQVEETRMNLPGMMFADGEEPVGVRVLTYQSSHAINSILSALDEEEIQFIRQSSFGKLVDIGDKPGFSEFAIVTGLPCGEFPKKQKLKKKKKINDKPYWPELFGSVEELRVSKAVKMLRKKTVTDKDIRIKLACLAIVSSVMENVDSGLLLYK